MNSVTILTITGACIGITRNAASFITGLNDLVVRLRDVELDLAAIEAQTGILGLVSERLRLWINSHQDELSEAERRRLWDCIHSCDQLLRLLDNATNRAGRVSPTATSPEQRKKARLGLWKRVQALIAQPQLERYATTLGQLGNALNTFLQVLQTTAQLERPAALQDKKTSAIIDDAISSASETSSRVRAWLQNLESDDENSSRDSGFGDASSNVSFGNPTGSARVDHANFGRRETSSSLDNSSIHRARRRRRRNNSPTAPRLPSPRPRESMTRSYTSGLPKRTRRAAAPGAPGGGDSPPPSDSDDNGSIATVRGKKNGPPSSRTPSPPPPEFPNQRVYDIRDELERMTETSSVLGGNYEPDDPVVEGIRRDLVRLQQIMVELRRHREDAAHNGIAPGLEAEIARLFDQVRDNLSLAGNEDEQILRGTDINSRNALGETALHIAARKRPVDLPAIRKFLRLGASPLAQDHHLNTPLLTIVSTKYIWDETFRAAVVALINAGADLDIENDDGWTALNRAADGQDSRALELLVLRGANVNTTTLDLLTPLHRAVQKPSVHAVDFLLSRAANPNALSRSGETPLSLVCQLTHKYKRAQATVVELLLQAGASPTAGPAGVKKPLDAVIKVLKEKERKIAVHRWTTGQLKYFLWDRIDLEASMYTLNILLGHLRTITLCRTTRIAIQTMYIFREMQNIEAIPIVNLRRRFEERIGEIVVLGDRELYDEVRRLSRA